MANVKRFLFRCLVVIALLAAGLALAWTVSQEAALGLGLVVLLAAGIALFRPYPAIPSRGFALALLLLVAAPLLIGPTATLRQQQDAALAALKASDPAAYLARLQASDPDRWLEELASIDPAAHQAEVERRQKEARRAELAENEEKRAEACSVRNDVAAFTAAQQAVTDRLKAPATADFQSINGAMIRPDTAACTWQVISYVDSQNSYGAMIRTRFDATVKLSWANDTWSLVALTTDP